MDPFVILWFVFFLIISWRLIAEYRKGRVYTPFFLISAAYILVLVVGAFGFEFFRGKPGPQKMQLLTVIGGSYLTFLLGLYLGSVKISLLSRLKAVYQAKVERIKSREVIVAFSALCAVAMVLYFVRAGTVPLFASDADAAKVEAMSGAGYVRIFTLALPVICLFLWYDYVAFPTTTRLLLAVVIIAFTVITSVISGSRGNSVVLIGEMVVIYTFLRKTKLPLTPALAGMFGLYFALSFLGAYRHTNGNVTIDAIIKEFSIIITARVAILDLAMAKLHDFRWGATYFADLAKLLPGQQMSTNVELKYLLFTASNMPEASGITPSILGEAYLNFSYYGMFAVMFVCGIIAKKMYLKMLSRHSREAVIFYAMLIMTMVSAVQKGIGPSLLPLFFATFWFICLAFVARERVWL